MSSPPDGEVIGRSLDEPEAFGLIYDRHAATLLRFLGRRVGAGGAEGLVGELFRIAFEHRKTFDLSRTSALPWLYGIGSNLLLKHRHGEARRLRASGRMAAAGEASKRAGTASQYITVHVDDIDAHHQRAVASGAEIVSRLHDHLRDYRVYEALDLEGHRWRFLQWLREVPQSERADVPVRTRPLCQAGEETGSN